MSIEQVDTFQIAGESFRSRLLLGTGKFKDLDETQRALAASGTEIVTVALRRLEPPTSAGAPTLLQLLQAPRASDGGRAHYLRAVTPSRRRCGPRAWAASSASAAGSSSR